MAIGLAVSLFFILKRNFQNNYKLVKASNQAEQVMVLSEEVTFLNKGSIQLTLQKLPKNATFTIDGSNCQSIDYDVLEILHEFKDFEAKEKNINITFINIPNMNH
jgi:MFS superfamily sulfate permease-like transporter